MSSDIELMIGPGMRCPESCRSRNRRIRSNLDICRNLEILAISAIFRISQDFAEIAVWQRFGQILVGPGIPARSSQTAVRTVWPESARKCDSGQIPGSDRIWPLWRVRPGQTRTQGLYIDHFQYPPRWKMTGEEGDPFGKSD